MSLMRDYLSTWYGYEQIYQLVSNSGWSDRIDFGQAQSGIYEN